MSVLLSVQGINQRWGRFEEGAENMKKQVRHIFDMPSLSSVTPKLLQTPGIKEATHLLVPY